MTSLLPYNATALELALEKALQYKINPEIIHGFKTRATGGSLSLALSWEYSLAQVNVDDFMDRMAQGIKFHCYSGTPYALRLGLSWYGFTNVKIEEEAPGDHYAQYQFGIGGIPNVLDVATLVNITNAASPLRARLFRMYNDLYDVRKFVLDESPWGNLLSDHSGYRPYEGAPKFSFGRINGFYTNAAFATAKYSMTRDRYSFSACAGRYKLDEDLILSRSTPELATNIMCSVSYRHMTNTDHIGDTNKTRAIESRILPKATCVPSDNCILDDINTCFTTFVNNADYTPFILSYSALSAVRIASSPALVCYKYTNEFGYSAVYTYTPEIIRGYQTLYRGTVINADFVATRTCINERFSATEYNGNNSWLNLPHLNTPWINQKNYSGKII